MKHIELIEKRLANSRGNFARFVPIFSPDMKSCCFVIPNEHLTITVIDALISGVFYEVHRNNKLEMIAIAFPNGEFDEKLTYIFLECYLEHIIVDHKITVKMTYNNTKKGIFTQGVLSSPLQNLMCVESGSRDKYLKSFKGETSRTHYRRVFSPDEGSGMALSSALTTLGMIFDSLNIPDEQGNPIAEVAVELVGNALEHTRSDCVLDVDIADNYVKRKEPDGKKYYGANICVLNFSPALLSSQLKEKMCYNPQISSEGDGYRYWRLKKAYLSQKKFFNENYADEEFFMLSAFQDKISGRPNEYLTGGTGLPTLIKSLELQAEDDNCYVLSGDRKMRFIRKFLEYDKERWLGMNRQCDFMNCIPDPSVFTHSPIYFPGTAYNLNFVIARET